jgi:spore coat protein U-like protein
MKKNLAIIAALGIVSMAGVAMAATADLDVSATVIPTCTMTGGTLAFGNLDPTNAVAKTASSIGVTITCTNDTDFTLSGNAGDNAVGSQKYLTNGTSDIPYSVTIPASGTGTGSALPVSIAGAIAAGSYTTATAGSYTDTIELTVTP